MRSGHEQPRSSASCAACKFLKRRCNPNCLFAPYFRSDEPKKFATVHKVFGASNVAKILAEVAEAHREDAVNSLVYEAEARLTDPVYGCIGAIAILQRRMVELQHELAVARGRLAWCAAASGTAAPAVVPVTLLQGDDVDQFLVNSLMMSEFVAPFVQGGSGNWVDHQSDQLELYQSGSSMDELSQLPFPK